MERYYFVYSVDFVTVSGRQESILMILDKSELRDTINTVSLAGGTITGVNCAMYDSNGFLVMDRGITHLFNIATNNN